MCGLRRREAVPWGMVYGSVWYGAQVRPSGTRACGAILNAEVLSGGARSDVPLINGRILSIWHLMLEYRHLALIKKSSLPPNERRRYARDLRVRCTDPCSTGTRILARAAASVHAPTDACREMPVCGTCRSVTGLPC